MSGAEGEGAVGRRRGGIEEDLNPDLLMLTVAAQEELDGIPDNSSHRPAVLIRALPMHLFFWGGFNLR